MRYRNEGDKVKRAERRARKLQAKRVRLARREGRREHRLAVLAW